MNDAKVEFDGKILSVLLPATLPTGKVRIKKRNMFSEYGEPISTRQSKIPINAYMEWQIGYDLLANAENQKRTALAELEFINYKDEHKYPYELAEILKYSADLKLITVADVRKVIKEVEAFSPNELIDVHPDAKICRTNPVVKELNGVEFYAMEVRYPLFVHRYKDYDILTEIIVREKQRAVGYQPMLYVCLPMCRLVDSDGRSLIGRCAKAKEMVRWKIGKIEAELALELFKIFGMLSAKHRFDVLAILKAVVGRGGRR